MIYRRGRLALKLTADGFFACGGGHTCRVASQDFVVIGNESVKSKMMDKAGC